MEALYDCFAPLYFVLHPFVKTAAAEASHFKGFDYAGLGDQLTQMGLHILNHNRWSSLSMYLCEVEGT